MKFKIVLLLFAVAVAAVACRHVSPAANSSKPLYYTCPMHPSVKADKPGDCPLCGMKLTPVFAETDKASAAPAGMGCCAAPAPAIKP